MLYLFTAVSLICLLVSGIYRLFTLMGPKPQAAPASLPAEPESAGDRVFEAMVYCSIAVFVFFGPMAGIHYTSTGTYQGSLSELASQLHTEYPELKGTLVCENEQLWVKGQVPLTIPYQKANHIFQYKVEVPQGSWGTSCLFNIYPSASDIKQNVEISVNYQKNAIHLILNGGQPRHDRAPIRVRLSEIQQMNKVVNTLKQTNEALPSIVH